MIEILRLLFGLTLPVDRRTYAAAGALLMALKLGIDALVLYLATGRVWLPWEYLVFTRIVDEAPWWAVQVLLLWALPFAWIGVSMSVRRAVDAGLSPWTGLLFCVPVLNVAIMLALCLSPSRRRRTDTRIIPAQADNPVLRAVGSAMLVTIPMTALSVFALERWGLALLAGTPLAMGVVAGYVYNRGHERRAGATTLIALVCLVVAGALVILFAIEGVLCLTMAMPLAIPLAILGALLGRGVARTCSRGASPLLPLLVLLPLGAWVEPRVLSADSHQVTTRIHVQASLPEVWLNVVSFAPLPAPRQPWFRMGIAYPIGAHISGRGAGAVRSCEFSTGAFMEPITIWQEPTLLGFEVTDQPRPLREITPYARVHADHRQASVTARRGEFRLHSAPGGGTILEGTTWYDLELFPQTYWALWTDFMIREIHQRVLEHIKKQTEDAPA